MGGACSKYGEQERCIQGFGWGNLWDRDHLEDPDADGRIILRWIFTKWDVVARAGVIWLRKRTGGGLL